MKQNKISVWPQKNAPFNSKTKIVKKMMKFIDCLQETEKSIRFYQNMHGKANDFELLQLEMLKLKTTNESPKLADNYNSGNSFDWSDLIQAPGRKAITIGIVLAALNQFCGCFAMLNYTAKIFKEAGSNMSPNMSAIIVGVIQLFGSYMATNLVERAGRKV